MDGAAITQEDVPPFIAVIGQKYTAKCAIIVEKTIVVNDIENLVQAIALFIGVIYAMDIQYPTKLYFEFLQKLILGLKGSTKLSGRIRTLNSKLVN